MFNRAKFWRTLRFAFLTAALLMAGFTLYLDFRVRSEFEGRRFALPARIYARPLELHAGLRIAQIDVTRELQEAGYREGAREGESGWFMRDNDWLEVAVRPFVFWDGLQPAKRVRVAFQGGRTLTQQLAKNFFLTPERTLQRKLTELLMAVLLEIHYEKDEILETYLNEIYLGQDRDRAIHGVGLAALYYFGKTVEHLTLAESALLVGMVKGPAFTM